jgi:hypothetical protein
LILAGLFLLPDTSRFLGPLTNAEFFHLFLLFKINSILSLAELGPLSDIQGYFINLLLYSKHLQGDISGCSKYLCCSRDISYISGQYMESEVRNK